MRHRDIANSLKGIKDPATPSPSSPSSSYYNSSFSSNSDSTKNGDLLGTSSGSRSIGCHSGPLLTSKNMGLLTPLSSSTSSLLSSQNNNICSNCNSSYLSNKANNGAFNNNDTIVRQNQTSSMHLKSSSSSSSPYSCSSSSNRLLTLPTILTLGRVAAVPVLITAFYVDGWWGTTATTIIFIAAAVTDWLDGYLARKMRLSSAFGAFLDPVADKLMVAATLVLLCTRPPEVDLIVQLPCLITIPSIAIIGREITMSAVREWAATQNGKLSEAVAVNSLGKWKTASQMTSLTILLATRDSSIGGFGAIVTSGVYLLNISAGLAVWSLIVYMGKVWKVLIA